MYQSQIRRPGLTSSTASAMKPSSISSAVNSNQSGEADQETFMAEFENVPRKQFFSSKELKDEILEIKAILEDSNQEWERRTEALRRVRNLLIDKNDQPEVLANLKSLELAFQCSLKDLRSRVVKECCISVAYFSIKFGQKCDRFIESLFQLLINLLQNSVKIMSSSALVCIRFVIQHTHSGRFIPILTLNLKSKSKELRRYSCEFLYQLLQSWPKSIVERHAAAIQENIKRGLSDADLEARALSRKAYWAFAGHCSEQANALLQSLDPSKRKLLQKDQIATVTTGNFSSIPVSHKFGQSKLPMPKSHLPIPASVRKPPAFAAIQMQSPLRTTSSIDIGVARSAAMRAKARGELAASISKRPNPIPLSVRKPMLNTNVKPSSSSSTASSSSIIANERETANEIHLSAEPSTPVLPSYDSNSHHYHIDYSPERISSPTIDEQDRSRIKSRYSQSQPNSRSASPTSKLNYLTHNLLLATTNGSGGGGVGGMNMFNSGNRLGSSMRSRRSSSRIPLRASGQQSPYHSLSRPSSRCGSMERQRHNSLENGNNINQTNGSGGGGSGVGDHDDNSSDLNSLINSFKTLGRNHLDDHMSDKSEVSSLCSERSHQSTSDRQLENVYEIIHNLRSTHWSTRKEGLLSFQFYLKHSPDSLTSDQLSTITKLFTMMLLDPHTKTFSLFLEILNELIRMYKHFLTDWLYVLLTRLFLKIGSDVLSSVQARVLNTLNIVRESFLREDQFNVIVRFLSDQAQTPSMKVKLTVVQYFNDLLVQMEPREWRYDDQSHHHWHELQLCLMKIISWTSDLKSVELKSLAGDVLINLLNLNTPKFFALLVQLPKTYQDAAYKIIQGEKKPAEEFSVLNDSYSKRMLKSVDCTMFLMPSQDMDNMIMPPPTTMVEDDLSQEDYYSSLKKTTDEISKFTSEMGENGDHHYSDEPLSMTKNGNELVMMVDENDDQHQHLVKTANSSSMDSGISQIDALPSKESTLPPYSPAKTDSVQKSPEPSTVIMQKKSIRPQTPPRTLPRAHVLSSRLDTYSCQKHPKLQQSINGILNVRNKFLDLMNNNVKTIFDQIQPEEQEDEPADLSAIFTSVVDHQDDHQDHHHQQQQHQDQQQSKQRALKELILKIQEKSNVDLWPKYFKRTLYFLFNCIDNRIQLELTLNALSELLLNHSNQFDEHIELFMVKLLQFSKLCNKELSSQLDHCYNIVGAVLSFDKCVPILLVTITMGEFPDNQIALKILTKFIESANTESVSKNLPDIMPPLIKAYDYHDSTVRKSSVFCLVEIFHKVGIEMKSYLTTLSPSKVKLLQLYIDRSNPPTSASLLD